METVIPLPRVKSRRVSLAVDMRAPTRSILSSIAWRGNGESASAVVRPAVPIDVAQSALQVLGEINWDAIKRVPYVSDPEASVASVFDAFNW